MHNGKARLDGLDAARYLAFAGMLLVNFQLAMAVDISGDDSIALLFNLLEGKASATFVVLSGIGLSLATCAMRPADARVWAFRRALFLLAVGLINLSIFPADILHYYAVYFLLAIPFLSRSPASLIISAMAVGACSFWLLTAYDYSQGWEWNTLLYRDIWTLPGALRNLLFNGFHPVFPWLAFLLTGMALGRMALHQRNVQLAMMLAGLALLAASQGLAAALRASPWHWLMTTTPLPPGPAYLLTGTGSALITIGTCLIAAQWRVFPAAMLTAGRMTLSLYLAHILLGMGTLEAMGMLNGTATPVTVLACAGIFLFISTLATWGWARFFRQGPVEYMMRWITAIPISNQRA